MPHRKLLTYNKLLEAARTVFEEKGYEAATPNQIAKTAGVGHGTFYAHFVDKADCFVALAEAVVEESAKLTLERYEERETLPDEIRMLLRIFADYAEKSPNLIRLATIDFPVLGFERLPAHRLPLAAWAVGWSEFVARWRRKGVVTSPLEDLTLGYAILGVSGMLGRHAMDTGDGAFGSIEETVELIAAMLTSTGTTDASHNSG